MARSAVTPASVDCFACPLRGLDALCPPSPEQTGTIQQLKRGEIALEKGGMLYEQDSQSAGVYTVLEGVLLRYRTLDDGRRQIVNFMFPGDLVGLQGAFDGACGHSVEAVLPSRVCIFDRRDFPGLIAAHPRLGYDLVWIAAQEENALEHHMVSLGKRNARERVAALAVWLLRRAFETGISSEKERLAIPITQVQIADMAGLSPVHANRTLQSLRRDGLVEWRPGELHVPDFERTADFAREARPRPRNKPYI